MFCINCGHKKTSVKNSRPSKQQASVWRRRHCPDCQHIFTTREEVAEDNDIMIDHPTGPQPFSIYRLSFYISRLIAQQGDQTADESYWLARTIRAALKGPSVSVQELNATTYRVLERYDPVAALQHGSRHGLVGPIKKRPGRPRLKRSID